MARNTPKGTRRFFLSNKAAHHGHHLDVTAAHCFLFQDPPSHKPDGEEQRKAARCSQNRLEEPVHAPAERQSEPEDEADPVVFVGDEVVARVGHRDADEDGAEDGRSDETQRGAVGQHRGKPEHADDGFDDRVLGGDGMSAPPALAPQQQPGDHGDVVAPRDRAVAVGAARRGTEQGAFLLVLLSEPQDADVEEAAEAESQDRGADEQEWFSDHAAPHGAGCPPRPPR